MRDDEWDRYEDAWFDDEDDLDVEESEDAHFFDSWKDDDSDFDLGFTKSSRACPCVCGLPRLGQNDGGVTAVVPLSEKGTDPS